MRVVRSSTSVIGEELTLLVAERWFLDLRTEHRRDAVERHRRPELVRRSSGCRPRLGWAAVSSACLRVGERLRNLDVACSVHLGLMRGALSEMGAPLAATVLEPSFKRQRLNIGHRGEL